MPTSMPDLTEADDVANVVGFGLGVAVLHTRKAAKSRAGPPRNAALSWNGAGKRSECRLAPSR